MHSDHSATFSGKVNGAGAVDRPVHDSRVSTLVLPEVAEHQQQLNRLSHEEPFGLTIIIGGTNVRFCISRPGDPEPVSESVTWQQLSDDLTPLLSAKNIRFEDAHSFVYSSIGDHCVRVLIEKFTGKSQSDSSPKKPIKEFIALFANEIPIKNLCSLNFSVAGRVVGDERDLPQFKKPVNGIEAKVSTTNTGLKLSSEPIGSALLDALQAKLPGLRIPEERVLVLNDARAGLEGEKLLQKISPDSRVFFEICGTGDGSDYDVDGFDEIGHRTMFNSKNHSVVVHVGDEIQEYLEPDGSFKAFKQEAHLRYAENMLSGPCVAIRFVKTLEEKHEVMNALANRIIAIIKEEDRKKGIKDSEELTPERVLNKLFNLADLKFDERTQWAVNSDSRLIKAINHLIFKPIHREIRRAMPCTFNVEALETSHPEKALVLYAWARQKLHFKERGIVAGAVYQKMVEKGVAPDRYILGGGLGEMFNRYTEEDRQDALDLINEHGKLPPGVFDFSRVSPEARESAVSYQTVEETKREWDEAKLESVPLPKFPH